VVLMQSQVRGWLGRLRFAKIKRSALLLQTFGRGLLARRHARFLKETRAATLIQKTFRMHFCYRKYRLALAAIQALQCFARVLRARQELDQLKRLKMAIRLQTAVRRWSCQRRFRRVLGAVVLLQACMRRVRAQRMLKQLRIEARTVEGIKEKNFALEFKILDLQKKLDAVSSERRADQARAEAQHVEKQAAMRLNSKDLESTRERLERLENENSELRASLQQACAQRDDFRGLLARVQQERDGRIVELTQQVRHASC
jgi:myosin V